MRPPLQIRAITAAQTIPLRSAVLRPGLPVEAAIFAGDDNFDAAHFGAFVDGRLIAVASVFPEMLPDAVALVSTAEATAHSWRLRGMAVEPKLQGQGYGRELLDAVLKHVTDEGGAVLWCNARTSAAGFYRAAGFETCGDEFVIPDAGPHYVMLRRVE